ncbi:hypothetical protein KUTeg_019839 [Tegillarca granosa]|uniref:mRNA (guanine-N(7))-methyltransferase n=1 Tax=Tegillarca granosa TaxID=220873 RepID=A0ABQ9EDS5_TEGGR|nr:hypothetical protein KUTeg_019839 [Tegillarca granosa]
MDPSESSNSENSSKMGDNADLTSVVAKHYNELQETGLAARSQSRIFYLRNFNNWIKSIVIGETLQQIRNEKGDREDINALDLCCGKGGDLLKWKKGRISKLVCADIASTSVEQAETRYNEMIERNNRERYPQRMFKAEFIAADCTKVRLKDRYKDSDIKFDVTSCQFSFHYCFESYPQAVMMMAEEFGMKLLYAKPFAEYYEEHIVKGECRSLIGKITALETYPAFDGKQASEKTEDYEAAEKFYKEVLESDDRPEEVKQRHQPRIGTLSKAEWEATTIYLVFAFQKVKDISTGEQWTKPENLEQTRKRPSDEQDNRTQTEKQVKMS